MENISVEYKRELTDGLEKEVVAFLNTLGGEIFIGVEDNGNIIGVENSDKLALTVIDRIKNNILPSAMGIFNVDVKQSLGKDYIAITVAQGLEKPYYLKKYGMSPNGCFYRVGSQSAQMPQSMINELFSRRVINTLHNVVSPNQELTFTQLKIFYEEKGYDVSGSFFLKNLDLFTEDGKYNYAAYLLSDNNGTSIKVARFKGTEKLDILERNEFGRCCLIKSAINVLEKLNVANSTVVRVGAAAQRTEMRLIDPSALREAVLNAIIHNDYINGAYPVFEIYDDRIEVVSSGGLPIGLSRDEFFAGRSLPRNKELMRVFSDMDMCEQLGSGMKKILKSYPESIFEISEHFISTKFAYSEEALKVLGEQSANKNNGEVAGKVAGKVADKLTRNQVNVLSLIEANPQITVAEMVSKLGLSDSGLRKIISTLKALGKIKRIGSDKTGYWKILK